ncbi:hypothetical protein EDEG_00111 [Edhazardia aedis USNM 41457]|uniref:Uncharacterized protein n=1 Tax=Edhazardia aedis (strain USNM 41457) TaxID=1003232 RepID=J9DAU9_EDHAE|nr:hypothetical protein EDEG_00111 [Edhazardia aedis USNM 41457]|eukprot:EJW04891.1 hypothetical protein EDEG_00111 [Edhazardia aedis USNM 41457]
MFCKFSLYTHRFRKKSTIVKKTICNLCVKKILIDVLAKKIFMVFKKSLFPSNPIFMCLDADNSYQKCKYIAVLCIDQLVSQLDATILKKVKTELEMIKHSYYRI